MKGKWHFVKSMLGVGLALLLSVGCFKAPVQAHAEGEACANSSCTGTYSNGFCSKNASHYQEANKTVDKYDVDADGVKDVVYEISNGGQLFWFAKFVNSGNYDANAVLTKDISAKKNDEYLKWEMIAYNSSSKDLSYNGVFDGQGYSISGISRIGTSSSSPYNANFIYILGEEGVLRNIGFSDTTLKGYGTYMAPGAVVYSNNGIISNVVFEGKISGYSDWSGFVGYNYGLVQECKTYGDITSVTGQNYGRVIACENYAEHSYGFAYNNKGEIRDCINYGASGGYYSYTSNGQEYVELTLRAVGLVHYNNDDEAIIENCINYGDVHAQNACGIAYSNGGVARNCINYGNVTGEYYIYGLGSNSGTMENCFNHGDVIGTNYVYGLGSNSGTMENCFTTGNIMQGDALGLVVKESNGTMTNCYYLEGTATATDVAGSVEGKTAEEFASGEVAYLLNGSTSEGDLTWFQTCGTGYPTFEGEIVYQYKDCADNSFYSNTDEEDRTHEGGVATCVEKAICDVCGEQYGELDTTNHREEEKCTTCGLAGTCGENLTWVFDEATGTLTISGEGAMTDYASASNVPWYSFGENIIEVVIEDGVTSIGNQAFCNCESLTEVTIGDGVTSIGDKAFWNCESLTEITIPYGVTSIGESAFYNCSALTEVTIPDSVTSIGLGAFGHCSALTEVTIPDGVTGIGKYVFFYCSALTEVTIPDSVTSIEDAAFEQCTSLTEVTIPNSVTSIGYRAFAFCTSLTEVTIPDGVTSIGKWAFIGCSALTEVTIPDGVTSIGDEAFWNCTNLTTINIGCNWKSDIDSGNFYGAEYIETVNYRHALANLANGANKCTNCGLVFGTCGENLTWVLDEATGTLTISGEGAMMNYALAKSPWYSNKKIKKVVIEDGVTSIGDQAFYYCTSLTEVTIPDSVTSIGDKAFDYCSSLTEITIPNSVTSIGDQAFYYCSSLTEVTIPDSVTSIGKYAFCGDRSLAEVTIGDSVTSIGQSAFEGCESLTEITVPDSVTSIGEWAFDYCTNLTTSNLGCKWKTRIDSGDFYGARFETVNMHHVGDACLTADDTEKAITLACEVCGEVSGSVTLLDPDADAKIVYDGTSKTTKYEGEIPGETPVITYSGVTATNGEAVKAGTYTATMTVGGQKVSVQFVIEKLEWAPNAPQKTVTVPYTMAKVKDVVLPENWAWQKSYTDLELAVEEVTEATAVYNGADKGNYKNEAIIVEITRAACVHEGGVATCVERATCDVCGEQYGELDSANHGEEEVCNQSEASCTVNGYTGDTCCVDCGTVLEKGEAIEAKGHIGGTATCVDKATCDVCDELYGEVDATNHGEEELRNQTEATCVADGYTGDIYCKDCDTVLVAGEAIAAKGHIGGTATCVDKAVCDVCGEKYGELDSANHGEKELRNQTEATCTAEGYTGDSCCKDCGAVLEAGEAIVAKGHIGGTATCVDKATCDVCDKLYGDVDATNHGEEVLKNQTEATCTAEGYTGDTCCKDCGAVLEAGEAVAMKEHVGGTATCTEKAVCEVCGNEYNEVDAENHGEEVVVKKADATCVADGYTGDICCADCGTVLVAGEAIAAKGHVGGTATCTEKATCEVCGEQYNDVDAANHGEEVLKNQTEATCVVDGYTGDICCADCGTVFVAGEAVIATGHEYKSEVTKEPTTAENGVRTYTCEKCGDTYTEEIEKLPETVTAEVTYATHWGNGGQVEITLTNKGETLLDGWNVELDLNIDAKLSNSWGDGYVTSFENGHVCITNQSWVTSFEAGATKKVYLQYEGTLPNLVTCVKSDDVLVSRINYLNHWGNGGQIEICLENLGDALNGSWGTELDINLIGTMTNTWGDGYVTSYENGHIVIENQSWVTTFEAGTTKSVWLQYDGVLPVYASNAVIK